MANRGSNESILDLILEKTSNIERASNSSTIRQSLKEAIIDQARNGREHRARMVTFNITQSQSELDLVDKMQASVNPRQIGPILNRATKE